MWGWLYHVRRGATGATKAPSSSAKNVRNAGCIRVYDRGNGNLGKSKTGAVYPICPGVTAGTFDPDQYEFVNLDYATILEEMETVLTHLREVNPTAKVLLTVSPVPLTATAEERYVLLSTMASKSSLRAVADQLYRRHAHVDYFLS